MNNELPRPKGRTIPSGKFFCGFIPAASLRLRGRSDHSIQRISDIRPEAVQALKSPQDIRLRETQSRRARRDSVPRDSMNSKRRQGILPQNEAPRANARGIFSSFGETANVPATFDGGGAKSAEAENWHSSPALRPRFSAKEDKTLLKLSFLTVIGLLIAGSVRAVCPVCTIAVSAGLGLCRWLGVDDMISGVWIGGLIISSSIWTLSWLKIKQKNFRLSWLIVPALFYITVLLPLWKLNIIGHPFNRFYGIDKLIFGIASGTIAFLVGVWLDSFLRKRNNGNQFFKFQKVVVPVLLLIIFSLISYLICKIRP